MSASFCGRATVTTGLGATLLSGGPDPSSPSNPPFKLLPTLRELILHHWNAETVFQLADGDKTLQQLYPNLVSGAGVVDVDLATAFGKNVLGSGQNLLLDTNPYISALDHYIAGDGRANENIALTAMHTVWARNHNFHVENLVTAGFVGSAEELFQAAKMINEAEYQRVVFTEYADAMIGGIQGAGDHGFDEYNPDGRRADQPRVRGRRVPRRAFADRGSADGAGCQWQSDRRAAGRCFSQSSRLRLDWRGKYLGRHRDAAVGGNRLQHCRCGAQRSRAYPRRSVRLQCRARLGCRPRHAQPGAGGSRGVERLYISEAVGFAGDLSPYELWEDFQTRNNLSGEVIAQFRAAYPDLVLAPMTYAAFVAANGDSITLQMAKMAPSMSHGIDRVDLWVGGLAESHINGGQVGQTFWVVLHEQFDRLQEGDRLYYIDRFDGFDFYAANSRP